jgi:hypothetical protein
MKRLLSKKLNRDTLDLLLEKWYPFLVSFIIVILYIIIKPVLIVDDLDNILNAIMSFTSILLGFLGVLITLIFSLTSLSIIGDIFNEDNLRELMHIYFKRCIQSGFVLIICTILLFFRKTISSIDILVINFSHLDLYSIDIIKLLWIFLTPYFSLASYRIIAIVLKAAFTPSQNDDKTEDTSDVDKDEKYEELREKYK